MYFVNFLALGDNLISLSLLSRLDAKVNLLGTKHTHNIAKLMNLEDKFNIKIVFDDIPAFYDIRQKGVLNALKDFIIFIKFLKSHNIKEIIVEKKDFRSRLLSFLIDIQIHEPAQSNLKVYEHRKNLIEDKYSTKLSLNSYPLILSSPKKIVINPLTRVKLRNIKKEHLHYILDILNKNSYEIVLIDFEKKYIEFKNDVKDYLTDTTLEDLKILINDCDLYIGGDSFLIHLAYCLQKNYFMVFYRDNDDFMPPNITQDFYIKAHKCDDFNINLNQKFKNVGLIK